MQNSARNTNDRLTHYEPLSARVPLEQVLKRIQESPPPGLSRNRELPTTCPECAGMGWQAVINQSGFQRMKDGKPEIRRCPCQSGADEKLIAARLRHIDGLTEAERQIEFMWFNVTSDNRDGFQAVVAATQDMHRPHGFVVLSGPPGIGKTMLSMCAVNDARGRGYASVYMTAKDLLDHLRASFAPDANTTYDARWDLITKASVLAIDELSLTAAKPWAIEQLEELIGIRYRCIGDMLTIIATNHPLDSFTPKLTSRFNDRLVIRPNLGALDFRKWRSQP